MEQSFGTTCHGAGRMMSRTAAVRLAGGRRIDKELDALGIIARARGHKGLAEEQPAAYKDVDLVVDVVDQGRDLQEGRPPSPRGRDQGLMCAAPGARRPRSAHTEPQSRLARPRICSMMVSHWFTRDLEIPRMTS